MNHSAGARALARFAVRPTNALETPTRRGNRGRLSGLKSALRIGTIGIRHLLVLVMLGLLLAPEARPEVRSYTVGVDVNCPTGLGE